MLCAFEPRNIRFFQPGKNNPLTQEFILLQIASPFAVTYAVGYDENDLISRNQASTSCRGIILSLMWYPTTANCKLHVRQEIAVIKGSTANNVVRSELFHGVVPAKTD